MKYDIICFNCWSNFCYNSNLIFFPSDGYFWKTSSSELVNNSSVLWWAVSRPFVLLQEWILKAVKSHSSHTFSHPVSPLPHQSTHFFPRHIWLNICATEFLWLIFILYRVTLFGFLPLGHTRKSENWSYFQIMF